MKTFYLFFGIRMETRPVRRAHSPRVETAEIWPPKSDPKISDKNANGSEGMKTDQNKAPTANCHNFSGSSRHALKPCGIDAAQRGAFKNISNDAPRGPDGR